MGFWSKVKNFSRRRQVPEEKAPPRVFLTDHAVERFPERFRPGLNFKQTRAELVQLLSIGELSSSPPEWFRPGPEENPSFLMVGDDMVLPLREQGSNKLVAITCLGRGTISPCECRRKKSRKNSQTRGRKDRAKPRRKRIR